MFLCEFLNIDFGCKKKITRDSYLKCFLQTERKANNKDLKETKHNGLLMLKLRIIPGILAHSMYVCKYVCKI